MNPSWTNPSLALYLGLTHRGQGKSAVSGVALSTRPSGTPLLWVHASEAEQMPALVNLVQHLEEEKEDATFLLTGANSRDVAAYGFSAAVHVADAPADRPRATQAFLTRWAPDLLVWAGGQLRPSLIHSARAHDVRMIMIDTTSARVEPLAFGRLPGLVRPLLRMFDVIMARDTYATQVLARQGAAKPTLRIGGALEQGSVVPNCDDATRRKISDDLDSRPVWLALGVTAAEIAPVIAAHRATSSLSPRLLLVLEVANGIDTADCAQKLRKDGWNVARRASADHVDAETQICICDVPQEHGLWLRIAPVCFMGGTLHGAAATPPFEAAALGSAILHGPRTEPFQDTYRRYDHAGAALPFHDHADFVPALEGVLAPDKAASLAAAAWELSSSGSVTMDRMITLLLDNLAETVAARASQASAS